MKIDINKVKQIPKEISDKFGLCIYGPLSEEINSWIKHHNMDVQNMGAYSNIYTNKKMDELFNTSEKFKHLDGFSPNLNKHLHIGHFSNLVLAKAFKSMGVADGTLAILGDTLEGEVDKEEALKTYHEYCNMFEYPVDLMLMASEMKCSENILHEGSGEYEGTKVFEILEEKIVGIKSDGSTSYFYQDVALAQMLKAPTLYLTGSEQSNHFASLKYLFPHIKHIGLGLVKANGSKMSSRLGNVIWMKEVLDLLMDNFKDEKLCYNVFAGLILKSSPKSDKNINMDQIENPLNSPGLYLSYTLAKLKSAGCPCVKAEYFESQDLQFKYMKAVNSLMPNILLEGLIDHAKKISVLYISNKIKDNEDNQKMFDKLGAELSLGMNLLGMFDVEKV
jgi:hypothetical protein